MNKKEPSAGQRADKGIFQWENNLIVVKFGSDLVVKDGISWIFLESIAKQIITLNSKGLNSVLVGSGAKALGEDDAYDGQRRLLEGWRRVFDRDNVKVAELLLTGEDLRYRSFIRSHILSRILRGRVMLINGDDSLNEGRGQNFRIAANNDLLAAHIAKIVGVSRLFLLTNVDGVYDKYGKVVGVIRSREQVEKDIKFRGKSKNGSGGMETKVESALRFAESGGNRVVFIARGDDENIIQRLLSGEQIGTRIQIYD